MSDTSNVLDLIDGAIDAWETSDDAMRWTPEADQRAEANPAIGEAEYHHWTDEHMGRAALLQPIRLDPAARIIEFTNAHQGFTDGPAVEANRTYRIDGSVEFANAMGFHLTEWQAAILRDFDPARLNRPSARAVQGAQQLYDQLLLLGNAYVKYDDSMERERMRYLHRSYRAKTRNRNRRTP